VNTVTKGSLALLPLVAMLASDLAAQGTYDQEEMKASFAAMQAEPWFTDGAWITDFDTAKQKAAETGKPIFAYFTRTYAY
jgi:hypothetical protein